jgi:hypothetical protein
MQRLLVVRQVFAFGYLIARDVCAVSPTFFTGPEGLSGAFASEPVASDPRPRSTSTLRSETLRSFGGPHLAASYRSRCKGACVASRSMICFRKALIKSSNRLKDFGRIFIVGFIEEVEHLLANSAGLRTSTKLLPCFVLLLAIELVTPYGPRDLGVCP